MLTRLPSVRVADDAVRTLLLSVSKEILHGAEPPTVRLERRVGELVEFLLHRVRRLTPLQRAPRLGELGLDFVHHVVRVNFGQEEQALLLGRDADSEPAKLLILRLFVAQHLAAPPGAGQHLDRSVGVSNAHHAMPSPRSTSTLTSSSSGEIFRNLAGNRSALRAASKASHFLFSPSTALREATTRVVSLFHSVSPWPLLSPRRPSVSAFAQSRGAPPSPARSARPRLPEAPET